MKKKIIFLIISLILASWSFIFSKKVEERTRLVFIKPHYRLWGTPAGFVVEHCVYSKCQKAEHITFQGGQTDLRLDSKYNLLYFIKNGSLLARNFLNHSENEIYTLAPEDNNPVFSFSNNSRFMALFSEKDGQRYYQIFDLEKNISEKKQVTFVKKDDQVIGIVDDFGKIDFHVIGLVRGGMEGQQYLDYITGGGRVRYRLTDNFGPYSMVAKQGNKILYIIEGFLRKLDLLSGAIEDKPITDGYSYDLSSDGHFAIKQKCETTNFCRFILWDVDNNKDYLLFTNNDGMFIDGFWSDNDKYYIFSGAGGRHLIDIATKRVYWPWAKEDKYTNWSLIDMW
jgi:hypothetical protein